jgi:hypothetical protein
LVMRCTWLGTKISFIALAAFCILVWLIMGSR